MGDSTASTAAVLGKREREEGEQDAELQSNEQPAPVSTTGDDNGNDKAATGDDNGNDKDIIASGNDKDSYSDTAPNRTNMQEQSAAIPPSSSATSAPSSVYGPGGGSIGGIATTTKTTTAAAATTTTTKVQKPIMKFLFPNEWIGQLIGKGGSIISNVNAVTQAVVKVSQTGDFHPGTQDRCVMCTADEPDRLYAAIDHVTKILISAQDAARMGAPSSQPYTIKISVPNAAGAIVIGKGGSVVKSIKEKSGANVSIGDSNDVFRTGERLCTVTCNIGQDALQKLSYAIKLVAAQLLTDKLGLYNNQSTKYSGVVSTPFINQIGGVSTLTHQQHHAHQQQQSYANYQAPAAYFQPQGVGSAGHKPLVLSTDALFNPSSIQVNPGQLTPQQIQQQAMQYAASTGIVGISAAPLPNNNDPGKQCVMKFGIPENLAGAVIGRGGSGIKEITGATGASIQVAQKGDFMPGTENRLVTITGIYNAVQSAQHYVSLVLSRETAKNNMEAFIINATMEYK